MVNILKSTRIFNYVKLKTPITLIKGKEFVVRLYKTKIESNGNKLIG